MPGTHRTTSLLILILLLAGCTPTGGGGQSGDGLTAPVTSPLDETPGEDPGGSAAGGGSLVEPISEAVMWATGEARDPADAFVAAPRCGPTDAVLSYTVTGSFPTAEPLDHTAARLREVLQQVDTTSDSVHATGTTSTGTPVEIVSDGATVTIALELERIPAGYDFPQTHVCG